MNEQTARGLAAELATHRFWRVEAVKPAPTTALPGCADEWWVTLAHRTDSAARFLISHCETPQHRVEIADVLAHWGAHIRESIPGVNLRGLRWY